MTMNQWFAYMYLDLNIELPPLLLLMVRLMVRLDQLNLALELLPPRLLA
jgi:hypothetical protein|uniref:Uncharacterized protein n=1 Tax=Picea glauca TaxID=3330 RepID=A0A124GN32_PICGL|nr:hypothetical protein ABT39_MTgene5724 [Picea glauca]QHR90656.1 hypothetical protein Q903MT_gene4681 [Picea sitchensis]